MQHGILLVQKVVLFNVNEEALSLRVHAFEVQVCTCTVPVDIWSGCIMMVPAQKAELNLLLSLCQCSPSE